VIAMSLRIVRKPSAGAVFEGVEQTGDRPEAPDNWITRLAKLIPAEALGLYSAATAPLPADMNPGSRTLTLWAIAIVCLAFSAAIRFKATKGQGKGPQLAAVAISLISFVIWLSTTGETASPIAVPEDLRALPTVVAVLWAGIVTYFYRGD
jgi:hypothetical protein